MNKIIVSLLKGKNSNKVKLLNEHFSENQLLDICSSDRLLRNYNLEKGYGFTRLKEILNLVERKDIKCITILDNEYPEELKEIFDPPFMFYVRGSVEALNMDIVSVVGTRKPSLRGYHETFKLSMDLGRKNIGVVSGLANGIDSAAHSGNISTGGKTIAVLGSGIDTIYPMSNRALAGDIISKGGAIISEFLPGESPQRYNFPKRNRIIAGLSRDLIIIQAPKKSGALITGDYALERGGNIYVHSIGIGDKRFLGSDHYFKEGAEKIDSAYPILKKYNRSQEFYSFDPEFYSLEDLIRMELSKDIIKYKGSFFKL